MCAVANDAGSEDWGQPQHGPGPAGHHAPAARRSSMRGQSSSLSFGEFTGSSSDQAEAAAATSLTQDGAAVRDELSDEPSCLGKGYLLETGSQKHETAAAQIQCYFNEHSMLG